MFRYDISERTLRRRYVRLCKRSITMSGYAIAAYPIVHFEPSNERDARGQREVSRSPPHARDYTATATRLTLPRAQQNESSRISTFANFLDSVSSRVTERILLTKLCQGGFTYIDTNGAAVCGHCGAQFHITIFSGAQQSVDSVNLIAFLQELFKQLQAQHNVNCAFSTRG